MTIINRAPRAGLVGFGFAGRTLHVPLLQAAGLQIAGVVTRRPAAVAAALPEARAVADLDGLLELPDLDLVVIATPNDQHEAQARKALEAGKCVVVDKPLAADLEASNRLLQSANTSTGTLTVFMNRRWDSDFLTVRRLLEERALGDVHTFEARWNRYRPQVPDRWREQAEHGGGLLLDLGPHLIDQALQLFGTPGWVQAELMQRRAGASVEDAFELRLGIGPVRVVLGADCLTADPGARFRLHGTLGSFTKSGLDVQEAQLRAGASPDSPDFGVEPESQRGVLVQGTEPARSVPSERGSWVSFYTVLRAHLQHEGPLPVDARDARETQRLIEAARHSAAAGGARVAL